eukprot:64566-Chlamydomonas_euryale.AAC.1
MAELRNAALRRLAALEKEDTSGRAAPSGSHPRARTPRNARVHAGSHARRGAAAALLRPSTNAGATAVAESRLGRRAAPGEIRSETALIAWRSLPPAIAVEVWLVFTTTCRAIRAVSSNSSVPRCQTQARYPCRHGTVPQCQAQAPRHRCRHGTVPYCQARAP